MGVQLMWKFYGSWFLTLGFSKSVFSGIPSAKVTDLKNPGGFFRKGYSQPPLFGFFIFFGRAYFAIANLPASLITNWSGLGGS